MAAKKLPPYVIFLMLFAILALAVAALRPVVEELRLVWKLRSPGESEWRAAAALLIERGRRSGLERAIETALDRDTESFGSWQRKLFEVRPRDVRWALPAYEAGLRHEDAAVRKASLSALLDPKWRRTEAVPIVAGALESPDPVIRWQAGYVLHQMGPAAAGAAPALVRAASDPDEHVRWASVYALGVMAPASPDAVPALVRALRDPSVLVAYHAAEALAVLGHHATPAVPALIEAFRKGDVVVKVGAAQALGALGRKAHEALPVILEALNDGREWKYESFGYSWSRDENREVLDDAPPVSRGGSPDDDGRVDLIDAAIRLGGGADDLLPCLSKLVRDPNYSVRQAAATALGWMGAAASPAIPDLVQHLADKEPNWGSRFPPASETNYAASYALGAIGPEAVPALVEALRSGESRTRCGAVRALAKMEHADGATIEALRSALSDSGFMTVITVARGLKRFDPAANLVPALLDAAGKSGNNSNDWRFESLDGLAGKEALPSLPLLRAALSKEDPVSACVAVRLLASMAQETAEPLRDLLAALEVRDKSIRSDAVEALGALASRAEEIVPRLIRTLESEPEQNIRLEAAGSLEKLGAKAGSALPALQVRFAAEENAVHRSWWLAAIIAISPGDPEVIDLLLREARGNWEVSSVLDLIVKAGPTARSFLSAVEPYLDHESLAVRLDAAEALWAVDRRVEPVLAIARGALADDWSSRKWSPTQPLYPPESGSEWRNPVRESAARLLSEMGPAGKPAVPELVRCLEFPGYTVRVLAAEALWRTAGDARLDVLIEAVEESVPDLSSDPDWTEDFTAEALRVLGDMGSEGRGAIPSLERLRDAAPAGLLRAAADEALRKIAR